MSGGHPAARRARALLVPRALLVSRALLVPLALALFVALGTLLRLEPVRRARGVEFDFDPAFHFRMVAAVIDSGRVPEIDPLGLAPEGKPIATVLPTLLYPVVAAWHRLLARLELTPALEWSAVLFVSLAGGLIGVPLYLMARRLALGRGPALLAAAFAVFSPAHVHRTAGHWLRYDALGALLVLGHLGALAAAVTATSRRGRALAGVLAALLLGAAVAAWRVPLLLVALEAAALLVLLAAGRLRGAHAAAAGPGLALVLALALALPYLKAGGFLPSHSGVLALATLGAAVLALAAGFATQAGPRARAARVALVLAVIIASLLAAAPSAYDSVGGAVAVKLGLSAGDVGSVLLAANAEMTSPYPQHLVDADYFSAALPLALIYALGRRFPRKTPWLPRPAPPARPGLGVWHAATITFFALTLLFARNKVIAGPLLALYPALLADAAGRRMAGGRARRFLLLGLAGLGLLWCANDARRLVEILPARRDPETRAVLQWLRSAARPGDVVLGDWGRGYAIQLATGLPTVTDGLLELPAMRRRIAAFAAALYAENERDLLALCRAHGARFVWVPAEKRRVNAAYAGRRYADYFTPTGPTARGARTLYARLLDSPADLDGFAFRFRAGPHVIYEVTPVRVPAK
jgi:hypothetical protein